MKNPIDLYKIGEKLEFNDARERTNGQRSEGIMTFQPGKSGPPGHIHTQQLEGFEVISGQMIARVNGREVIANAGETILVQAGETHTFRNGSDTEPLIAKFWYEPALHIEWLLQTMGEDAMRKGGDWAKVPFLKAVYMMYKMRSEYRLMGIPYWLQDVLFGFLAAIARIMGISKKIIIPDSMK